MLPENTPLDNPVNNQVEPLAFIYSVNTHGKDKDWDFEQLTTGFEDRSGTLDDLKIAIASGYAITGAHFDGQRRKTANVRKVGLVLVDIDGGMTIDQALADPFVSQYCALTYTTPSHTPKNHRFRLSFLLPQPMGRDDFESLVKIFLEKFPADPSCKDAGRAFYGNTQADFFIENPGAILPIEWIEKAIADAHAEQERLEQQKRERQEWLKANRPFITDAISLLSCCSLEVRQNIQNGVPSGSGHNDLALKVLAEIIGVERYLITIGQPTQETARQIYDDFLLSSGVSDHRADQRWEWAESKDWFPSLSPDKIDNCIKSAKFNQLPPQDRQKFKQENDYFPEREKVLDDVKQGGSLGDQLSQLLPSVKDNRLGTFLAAIKLAGSFDDPIGELSEWIRSSFSGLDKRQTWPAIELVAAVCADYGDKAINDLLASEIKENTRLTQIRPIRAAFHSARKEIYPPTNERREQLNYIENALPGLRFNELTGKVERDGREYKDIDYAYLSPELIDCPKEINKQLAVDGIVFIAKKSSYHPVREYLDNLTAEPLSSDEWENLAPILLGTDPGDKLSKVILSKALISLVARIYKPGCYVRLVTVLQGIQNAGKSTFLRLLAGDDFFCDSLGKLDNPKDDLLLLHSHWLHEWSEIDKLTKKSSGDVKAFITKTKDDYRAPYAKAPESHLRQCVIFGTCNRTDFLQDATGNTRYSVIPVGEIDLEKTKEWRDRIWATAKALYLAGEGWELTQAEQALSELNNQNYADVDPWLETIGQFIDYREVISVNEILENLGIDSSKRDKLAAKRVRDCLTVLGWIQDKSPTYGGEAQKVRRWRPSLGSVNGSAKSVTDPVCSKCVPEQSLVQQDFDGLGSVGSVKNAKKIIQDHTQLDNGKLEQVNCEKSGSDNIGNHCSIRSKDPQTLTQQVSQLGSVNGSVTDPKSQWVEKNGQPLRKDLFVWHKKYGSCQIVSPVVDGWRLNTQADGIPISSGEAEITHVWEVVNA
jgi:hypothetical protein